MNHKTSSIDCISVMKNFENIGHSSNCNSYSPVTVTGVHYIFGIPFKSLQMLTLCDETWRSVIGAPL